MNALVDRLQGPGNREVVLELDRDLLVCEGFEDREYELQADVSFKLRDIMYTHHRKSSGRERRWQKQ